MGPLAGLKVIEIAGIGPGPMCAMLLADLGATVLRIDRTAPSGLGFERPLRMNLLLRNRPALPLDLKRPDCIELVLRLWEVKKFRERKAFTVRWAPATADQTLAQFGAQLRAFMEVTPHPAGQGLVYAPPAKLRPTPSWPNSIARLTPTMN